MPRKMGPRPEDGAPPSDVRRAGRALSLIRVGTCAFADHQGLYPPGVKPGERLSFYAREFNLVEVDAPFYGPLPLALADRWLTAVPEDFRFDLKAPGSTTGHRAANPEEERHFAQFAERLHRSGRLGAVLLQWPPWHRLTAANQARAAEAVARFAPLVTAVEFRHRSWYEAGAQLTAWLTGLPAAQVIVDAPVGPDTAPPWQPAIARRELAYVRFHGRNAAAWSSPGLATSQDRFRYRYAPEELAGRVPDLANLAQHAGEVHVLMNNNYGSYAVDGARWLRDRLAPRPGTQTQFDW